MSIALCWCLWGVSEEQKLQLASQLQDISKLAATSSKVVLGAEAALPNLNKADVELMMLNLERLKAALQEAEEVSMGAH